MQDYHAHVWPRVCVRARAHVRVCMYVSLYMYTVTSMHTCVRLRVLTMRPVKYCARVCARRYMMLFYNTHK